MDCPPRAVATEDAFIVEGDETDANAGLVALLALAGYLTIRQMANEAAKASVMNVIVVNDFFVLAPFMDVTSPRKKDCSLTNGLFIRGMNETKITLAGETPSAGYREIRMWDYRVKFAIGELGAISSVCSY